MSRVHIAGERRPWEVSAQTATETASAALQFGQADDIPVLTLARLRAPATRE